MEFVEIHRRFLPTVISFINRQKHSSNQNVECLAGPNGTTRLRADIMSTRGRKSCGLSIFMNRTQQN